MGLSKMNRTFWSLAVVFISVSLVFYFFTIESFEKITVLQMKMTGVSERVDDKFHFFEKNNCENPSECECVLLLHGLGDFALTWSKMLSEDENNFSYPLHMYAPNLPGAMKTPKLQYQEDYNIQNLASLVTDHFLPRCDSWYVVGNSYGGWLATFVALNNPKVKGLLLIAPAGLNKDYSAVVDYFLDPDAEGAEDFYKKIYAKPKNVPKFIFERVAERAKSQPVIEQLRSIRSADFIESLLPQIKIPVSFLWGDSDEVIPTDWARSYAELAHGSELVVVNNCGHVPQKECFHKVLESLNSLIKLKAN